MSGCTRFGSGRTLFRGQSSLIRCAVFLQRRSRNALSGRCTAAMIFFTRLSIRYVHHAEGYRGKYHEPGGKFLGKDSMLRDDLPLTCR